MDTQKIDTYECRDGLKHGKGRLVADNGEVYEGDFLRGDIEGEGMYTWGDGRCYKGPWKNNKQQGLGMFLWPDGRKYMGQYNDGKIHGMGKLEWPDGRAYEGEWQDGVQNGKGTFWKSAGKWKTGTFDHGKVVRFFESEWQSGEPPVFEYPTNAKPREHSDDSPRIQGILKQFEKGV